MSYVVLAEFRVKAGMAEQFLANMRAHAIASRAEPDCQLFEVAQDPADPTHIVLYERYTNRAAYNAHRATPHYQRFRTWGPPLLEKSGDEIFLRRSVLTHEG